MHSSWSARKCHIRIAIEHFHRVSKIIQFTGSLHIGVQVGKVICAVFGCSKQSGCDKDVSFHRIPTVTSIQGKDDSELRKKCRDGFLAAISRKDVDVKSFDNLRICSKHFTSGEPSALYNVDNPDWLPTMNLGYEKMDSAVKTRSVDKDTKELRKGKW